MTGLRAEQEDSSLVAGNSRLLVSAYLQIGSIHPGSGLQSLEHGIERIFLQRGMPVLTEDGVEAGRVAAVVVDGEDGLATHFLLGRLPRIAEYRLVSLELISGIEEGSLTLAISGPEVEDLPVWHSPV